MLATSCAMYEVVPINDRIDNHRHALQRDLTIIDTRRSLRSVRHYNNNQGPAGVGSSNNNNQGPATCNNCRGRFLPTTATKESSPDRVQ